jgi:hypothetical protein
VTFSPLCIEEFDLSDKNFRPCPCGYQVCPQFVASLRSISDTRGRSVSFVLTASKTLTKEVPARTAADRTTKKQYNTRFLPLRSSSSTSRTKIRNRPPPNERKQRSARSRTHHAATSRVCGSNNRILYMSLASSLQSETSSHCFKPFAVKNTLVSMAKSRKSWSARPNPEVQTKVSAYTSPMPEKRMLLPASTPLTAPLTATACYAPSSARPSIAQPICVARPVRTRTAAFSTKQAKMANTLLYKTSHMVLGSPLDLRCPPNCPK